MVVQAVMQVIGSNEEQWGVAEEASCLVAAHLLFCGSVPNRLWTGTSFQPRAWGPLLQGTI